MADNAMPVGCSQLSSNCVSAIYLHVAGNGVSKASAFPNGVWEREEWLLGAHYSLTIEFEPGLSLWPETEFLKQVRSQTEFGNEKGREEILHDFFGSFARYAFTTESSGAYFSALSHASRASSKRLVLAYAAPRLRHTSARMGARSTIDL